MINVYEKLKKREGKLAVVGLGYVGLPLALEFAKYVDVIGFDLNKEKIESYKKAIDPNGEMLDKNFENLSIQFTSNAQTLKDADFVIVAVPTPINKDRTPNLKPVISATELVAANLKQGAIIVYESTVYPGVTEEICVPIIEKYGHKQFQTFNIGYSPERINPGDKVHTLTTIIKIVSGDTQQTLEMIKKIYEITIKAGVYPVSSIKVAEAAKVVENSQRDINIAFINELAMAFDKMGIDTNEVIDAMNTKWNALGFRPGLVGGHCISVDPYYFIYQAEKLGYSSQIISAGRRVNDSVPYFIFQNIIKSLILSGKKVKDAKVYIFGVAFKENCADFRNTKVLPIVEYLEEYGIKPIIIDEWVNKEQFKKETNREVFLLNDVKEADAIVFAVAHKEIKNLSTKCVEGMFNNNGTKKVIIDIKNIINKEQYNQNEYLIWRL